MTPFRQLRQEADVTLQEVADECEVFGGKVNPSTVSLFERNLRRLKPETAEKIWFALTSVAARRALMKRELGARYADGALAMAEVARSLMQTDD